MKTIHGNFRHVIYFHVPYGGVKMNKRTIKCLITSLVIVNSLSLVSIPVIADTTCSNSEYPELYAHKDKSKGFDVFSEENYKYLSSAQKKELKELKKCKDKGELSDEQKQNLHALIDYIIVGKLGDKKYADFKVLIEKRRSNENLTEDENKRLNEYNDIIDGTKPTSKDLIDQFLR